ncbi:MAG TPA: hypothetical protein VFD73_09220, partial [Gemmatimonadales bacterium]|nr:hypothetical protein [Gemmatimonadales bacterium]
MDEPRWTRIQQFARSWADASSPLSRKVEEVWLEFDVCLTQDTPNHTPSVFFSIGDQDPQEPAPRRTPFSECLSAAEEGLQILGGRRTSSATRSTLVECFHRLPSSARILFLGAMISRDTSTVRVVASGLSLDDILRYLQRLGVHDPVEHLPLISDISNL